jgi:GTP cyclohydrolase I
MSVPAVQSGLALVDDGEAPTRQIDHEALQHAVGDVLRALGANTRADGLRETPRPLEQLAPIESA